MFLPVDLGKTLHSLSCQIFVQPEYHTYQNILAPQPQVGVDNKGGTEETIHSIRTSFNHIVTMKTWYAKSGLKKKINICQKKMAQFFPVSILVSSGTIVHQLSNSLAHTEYFLHEKYNRLTHSDLPLLGQLLGHTFQTHTFTCGILNNSSLVNKRLF